MVEDDEKAFFDAMMSGVEPLKSKDKQKVVPQKNDLKGKRLKIRQCDPLLDRPAEAERPFFIFSDYNVTHIAAQESLFFAREDVSEHVIKPLRKGESRIEATLDLHGCTVDKARIFLDIFIHESIRDGRRVLRIIHGKSFNQEYAVLKSHLAAWLVQHPMVLVYVSCIARLGGEGALLVLLRKNKQVGIPI